MKRSSLKSRRRGTAANKRRLADQLVAEVVKRRDGYTCRNPDCQRTAHTTTIDWAHILSRAAAPRLRWEYLNAIALCRRCHDHFTANPTAWHVFIGRAYPGRLDLLRTRALDPRRIDVDEVIADARRRLGEAA